MLGFRIEIKSNFHEKTVGVIARHNDAGERVKAWVPAKAMSAARRRICGHHDCRCSLVLPDGWQWASDNGIELHEEEN